MRQLRQKYKDAKQNYNFKLRQLIDVADRWYRDEHDTHFDKGCIFSNTRIIPDRDGFPDMVLEVERISCEYFNYDCACKKQDCNYYEDNIVAVNAKHKCENIHQQLRNARRRFWGLEK